MIRIIQIALISLLLASCGSSKSIQHSVQTTDQHDSNVYVERVKIDTIRIPSETLEVKVPITVFKTDTVVQFRNGRASTQIIYRDGVMTIKTSCDSLERLVLSYDRYLMKAYSIIKSQELQLSEKKTIVVPIPWYYKASLWIVVVLTVFYLSKGAIKTFVKFK